MNNDGHDRGRSNTARGTTRLVDYIPDASRRSFLQAAMTTGIAAPAAIAALSTSAAARSENVAAAHPGKAGGTRAGIIVRDFSDPYIELLRLLREGAEVEHAVMLQYLYCAFSIKSSYQPLIGFGNPTADNVLGVAVQEMQHLGAVNRLLVALGGSPHLDRQDFPYEPDIYPFPFTLEPLSRKAVAKYAYLEGPGEIFSTGGQHSPEDARFRDGVLADIDGMGRANQVGSLYRNVLDLLTEASGRPGFPLTPAQVEEWREGLHAVMEEGEHDHYLFFRQLYESKHPALAASGVDNVWDLDIGHEAYPAHQLAHSPTGFVGHPNQIDSEDALAMAWLGNLHYWTSLCCLDYSYRYDHQGAMQASVAQMMTGLWPLAAELPKYGVGMPFDPLSMGYSPSTGKDQARAFILAMAREAQNFARGIEHLLPARYQDGADAAAEMLEA